MTHSRSQSQQFSDKLAIGLGWLGIGMGLYQLLAPHSITQALGTEGAEALVRGCGARNLVTGCGALSVNPKPALWVRSAGDALDLAGLLILLADRNHPKRGNVKLTLAGVGACTVASLYCAQDLSRRHAYQAGRTPDYSGRSGFPQGVKRARGAAIHRGGKPPALPSPARLPGPRLPASSPHHVETGGYAKGSDYHD